MNDAAFRDGVYAVAPSWIATPLTEIVRNDAQQSATILARTPLGRWGEPAEVANVVSFSVFTSRRLHDGCNRAG